MNTKNALDVRKARHALNRLEHRGPDAEGIDTDNQSWFLGHRRLSIIDLSTQGNQPIWDESGKIGIVFNGEIYNYHQLKKDLKNGLFRTQTDTEVILRGFLSEGITFFKKLRGIYAFVIIDLRNAVNVIAVRDPSGVKPLYVHHSSYECALASEIKAIKQAIDTTLTPNLKVLQSYLQLGFCPEPETAYNEISSIKPGHVWQWSKQGTLSELIIPYFIHQNNAFSEVENREKTAYFLREAVQKNLVSDVPCAVALSGGIDSSLVYYYAHDTNPDILALTVGFERDHSYNEAPLSKEYSTFLKGKHEVISMEIDAGLQQLNTILKHFDQPFADTSAIPFYFLTKASKAYSKVLIGGDGGDELFNGYPFMHLARSLFRMNKCNWMQKALPILSPAIPGSLGRKAARIEQMMQYTLPYALINLNSWIPGNASISGHPILKFDLNESLEYMGSGFISEAESYPDDIITAFNFRQILLGDYLKKTDMMSMLNGVEYRVPFLDEDLVNFAMSVPFDQKSSKAKPKKILRTIHREVFKGIGSDAPKSGFRIPLDSYLSLNDKQAMAQLVMSCAHPLMNEWINPIYKKAVCSAFLDGKESKQFSRGGIYQKMIQLYALALWFQDFD
jgi:asparagine synthase (glutamine-hydrolysing)